ncbi:hypothetical protein L5515_007814 [Caenorhabditis briggsae]|uniref:Uncharacterized protein n=1 Tax=Caenorhabditis briggsae TaxID=6238 RepID=A0AAE9F5N8_CAEBR|nr:hypothetical protein L5515_007814 [Caenorhabditis briggsae]
MMEHVAGGSFVGMPLSPNEQVLRAVCYCDKATFAHHRLRRVDPLMPIRFSTGNDEEIPAVDEANCKHLLLLPPTKSNQKRGGPIHLSSPKVLMNIGARSNEHDDPIVED